MGINSNSNSNSNRDSNHHRRGREEEDNEDDKEEDLLRSAFDCLEITNATSDENDKNDQGDQMQSQTQAQVQILGETMENNHLKMTMEQEQQLILEETIAAIFDDEVLDLDWMQDLQQPQDYSVTF